MILMRFFILFVFTATLHAAAPDSPTGLLTNGIENPLAIDVAAPSFTWMMSDADRAEIQTFYQIVVSSSPSNTGDVWNSGKTASSQSASVPYAGPALSPATRYWWTVKLWDKDGLESSTSVTATFDTGLNTSHWTA